MFQLLHSNQTTVLHSSTHTYKPCTFCKGVGTERAIRERRSKKILCELCDSSVRWCHPPTSLQTHSHKQL